MGGQTRPPTGWRTPPHWFMASVLPRVLRGKRKDGKSRRGRGLGELLIAGNKIAVLGLLVAPSESRRQLQAVGSSKLMKIQQLPCQFPHRICGEDLSPCPAQQLQPSQSSLAVAIAQNGHAVEAGHRAMDLDRVIFALPSAMRDTILPLLDRLAELTSAG